MLADNNNKNNSFCETQMILAELSVHPQFLVWMGIKRCELTFLPNIRTVEYTTDLQ